LRNVYSEYNVNCYWFADSAIQLLIRRFTFIKIIQNVLVTYKFNFTVVGGPTLVPNPVGGLSLLLNGLDQYLDLTRPTGENCLWNLEDCDLGLTVTFRLKVKQVRLLGYPAIINPLLSHVEGSNSSISDVYSLKNAKLPPRPYPNCYS
jgi:hypothetical protein